MILKKSHKDIDKTKWDSCIKNSQFPIIYGYSWYLDSVSPNWSALIIESNNQYDAVFPLTEKNKFGFNYLAQPFFCQQLGLFYRENTEADIELFVSNIQKSFAHFEITLNETNYLNNQEGERTNHVLDLSKDYYLLEKEYTKNRKRDLIKAKNSAISIVESQKIDDFISFFWEQKGNEIDDLTKQNYNLIIKLFTHPENKKSNKLLFALNEKNELISASYFLIKNNRIIFLLGTSNNEGKKKGVMTFIFDHIIREYSNQNMTLDFEGSNIPGVAKFYKSLGGKEKKYISLKGNSFFWGRIVPRIARLIQR